MTKITQFTKENLDPVIDDMMTELRKVGEKWGVEFSRKTCRYGSGDFRMTVEAKVRDRQEGVTTKPERDYDFNATLMNLPNRGYSYFSNGITLTVVGWNSRARKYPVTLKGSDGKGYKCSVESLRARFADESGR